jgi:plasmid replication initiation protein
VVTLYKLEPDEGVRVSQIVNLADDLSLALRAPSVRIVAPTTSRARLLHRDIVEWALKDDRHSMEHPFFSLSKNPDLEIRRYEHNGISITVTPSVMGIATIWDKDILIYAVSQLVEGLNQGRADIGPLLRVTAYDLLVATNRYNGGKNYEQLADAFRRLAGTRIETDIKTNGVRQRKGFGLIDSWQIIERNPSNGRMVAIQLRLSDWLYNAVVAGEILTLNRDYFRLRPDDDFRYHHAP